MPINKAAPTPLHYQLTSILREKLIYGSYSLGDLFPTEKELMLQYELSSTTVRRALSELVQEGWLKRQAGKGTFICKLPEQKTIGLLMGFFQEMTSRGFLPAAEVLSCAPVTYLPPAMTANPLLQQLQQQPLFLIERIIKLDNKPAAYITSYWPQEYGIQLAAHNLLQEGLYEIAARELKLILTKAEQSISAQIADKQIASFLGISIGSPLLVTERLAFASETPVEYSTSLYCASLYKYHITLYQNNKNT